MQLIINSKRTIENPSSEVICNELDSIPKGHEFWWVLSDTDNNFVQARGSLDKGFSAEYRSIDGLFISSDGANSLEQIKKLFLYSKHL